MKPTFCDTVHSSLINCYKTDQLANLNTALQSHSVKKSTEIFIKIFAIHVSSLSHEFMIQPLFQIDLVLTCEELLEPPLIICLTFCIFIASMLLRSLQHCIQRHQKPCYLDGLGEVNEIGVLKNSDMA